MTGVVASLGCAITLAACGDTLQDQPIASSLLEQLVVVHQYPVYWLGGSFQGMAVTNVVRDPSGAFTVQYGDCIEGGQSTCVPPLAVVTSPDNSFRPTGEAPTNPLHIRGVTALLSQQGRAIEMSTGAVVVDIYAGRASVALAAAQAIAPINRVGLPGQQLPAPQPDSGFAGLPLASQVPPPTARAGG
ncbi:MAG TPA: hypothetical protein VIC05_11150 [Solirubrobacteraceae bacterium]